VNGTLQPESAASLKKRLQPILMGRSLNAAEHRDVRERPFPRMLGIGVRSDLGQP